MALPDRIRIETLAAFLDVLISRPPPIRATDRSETAGLKNQIPGSKPAMTCRFHGVDGFVRFEKRFEAV